MKKAEVLSLLKSRMGEVKQRYDVCDLALFGSTSRDAARPESDIGIRVTFDGLVTSSRYFGLQFYLEDLLGVRWIW